MTNYIGYQPAQEIVQYSGSRWDYVNTGKPALDTNPQSVGVTWLNLTTGEEFVCIDNTIDDNVWRGSLGSLINDAALRFVEANQDFVNLGNDASLQFTTNFSVECTFRTSGPLSFGPLVSKWNLVNTEGWSLNHYNDGTLTYGMRLSSTHYTSYKSNVTLALDTEYTVKFFYPGDGTVPTLYINGEVAAQTVWLTLGNALNGITDSSEDCYMGRGQIFTTAEAYYNGLISSVKMWNGNETTLVSDYNFHDVNTSDATVEDLEGSNDGTITGAVWVDKRNV